MFTFVLAGHHIFALNENLSVVLCLHNMVLELKFTRFHDQPWGFRLSGGSDFEIPLTVIKVTKDGLAERLGLRVGDIVVRVNDTPTSNLKHSLAQEVILGCGNSFVMALLRPVDEGGDKLAGSRSAVSVEFEQISAECQMPPTPDSLVYSDMSEVTISEVSSTRSNSREDVVEELKQRQHQVQQQVQQQQRMQAVEERESDITDDHIAELLSGEAEVLKEHNVIGVNFQKIIPQAGLIKSSEVFKHLNAEAVKTKAEKENESKRWTTFLQKPDRPIPKSPDQIEMERRKEFAYRIKLDILPKSAAPQKPDEKSEAAETNVEDNSTDTPAVSGENAENACCDGVHCGTPPCEKCSDTDTAQPEEPESVVDETSVREDSPVPTPLAKTEDELLVERKLSDIQQQLLALSALPLTIQATLDAVTRQLTDLMPTLKSQHTGTTISAESLAGDEASNATEDNKSTTTSCDDAARDDASDSVTTTATTAVALDGQALASETDSSVGGGVDDDSVEVEEEEDEGLKAEEDIKKQRAETVFRRQEEEWLTKREKEQKRMAEEAARKRALLHPRRPSKAQGGPLTPQGRPVVLPGGRKWRNERDAFNEDFIKEVISSQAELIAGNALGHTFESPLLGYDERVNFLKYKKPEKDLSNLDRSETFKIIHHIEQEPRHGIPVRAPMVLCEEDVRNRAASCV